MAAPGVGQNARAAKGKEETMKKAYWRKRVWLAGISQKSGVDRQVSKPELLWQDHRGL